MKQSLSHKSVRDALLVLAFSVFAWLIAMQIDGFEHMVEFFELHDSWQLDEYFTAFVVFGTGGLIYAVRRSIDLSREIRDRRKAQREVNWLARHDTLTRLPNRRFVEDYLANRKSADAPITAYMIDLDGFKRVNDLLGHEDGDKLLVEVGDRLAKLLPGAVVARQGGDEFLALVTHSEGFDAGQTARRIIDAISAPMVISGTLCEVGAAVGYADHPGLVDDPTALLRAADLAMYTAKRSGRNRSCAYDKKLEASAMARANEESALRNAMRDKTIEPYFQPLISLQTGRIEGFEALARWPTADGTEMEPRQFIALAEELGLIVELSDYLLRRACQAARQWPNDIMLSFNISPAQFADPLLGLRLLKILDETGLPPNRLEIEISETTFVRDTEAVVAVITALHQAGIRMALDDFGTGYSSMVVLADLAIDKIKIDRSFIAACSIDDRQKTVVKTIVALSKTLGLKTTAEGIEDEHQLAELRAIGCETGQGFLFSKALSAAATARLFAPTAERRNATG